MAEDRTSIFVIAEIKFIFSYKYLLRVVAAYTDCTFVEGGEGGSSSPTSLSVVSADIYSMVQGSSVLVSVHFRQVGSLVSFVTYIKMVLPIMYHISVMVSLPHISLMLS